MVHPHAPATTTIPDPGPPKTPDPMGDKDPLPPDVTIIARGGSVHGVSN